MSIIYYQLKNNSREEYIKGVKYIFKKHPQLCESYYSADKYIAIFYSAFVTDYQEGLWKYPLVMRVIDDRYLAHGTDFPEKYKSVGLVGCNNLGEM